MDINQQNQIVEPKKYSSIIKWSLIIGIVIVVNLFINYAISLVYESPKFENYCKQEQVVKEITAQKECVDVGGQWNPNVSYVAPVKGEVAQPAGYCDQQFTCRNEYDKVNKVYERNVFIILVAFGIALVAGSFALAFNWILSVAASMAGILSIIIASIRYWGEADNWLRVLILFVALCSLIYFAVRKFKD